MHIKKYSHNIFWLSFTILGLVINWSLMHILEYFYDECWELNGCWEMIDAVFDKEIPMINLVFGVIHLIVFALSITNIIRSNCISSIVGFLHLTLLGFSNNMLYLYWMHDDFYHDYDKFKNLVKWKNPIKIIIHCYMAFDIGAVFIGFIIAFCVIIGILIFIFSQYNNWKQNFHQKKTS